MITLGSKHQTLRHPSLSICLQPLSPLATSRFRQPGMPRECPGWPQDSLPAAGGPAATTGIREGQGHSEARVAAAGGGGGPLAAAGLHADRPTAPTRAHPTRQTHMRADTACRQPLTLAEAVTRRMLVRLSSRNAWGFFTSTNGSFAPNSSRLGFRQLLYPPSTCCSSLLNSSASIVAAMAALAAGSSCATRDRTESQGNQREVQPGSGVRQTTSPGLRH